MHLHIYEGKQDYQVLPLAYRIKTNYILSELVSERKIPYTVDQRFGNFA